MSKHLIYMGFTETAHRIGLFDTDHIVRKSIPIKDVPVMSLAGIYSLRGVRKLAEGESVAALFGIKCEYEIRRRATQ